MTGLATVAAGDCLYRKLVSGAYIPIRIDCHNGHVPSALGGHIAFRIHGGDRFITALPSNGLVRSILREHGCFDGVRVANGQNAFIGIQRNGLDCLTDGDLGARLDDTGCCGDFCGAIANGDQLVPLQLGNRFVRDRQNNVIFCGICGLQRVCNSLAGVTIGFQGNIIHFDRFERLVDGNGAFGRKFTVSRGEGYNRIAAFDTGNYTVCIDRGNAIVPDLPSPVDFVCCCLLRGRIGFLLAFIGRSGFGGCAHIDLYLIGQMYRRNCHPASRQNKGERSGE